MSDWIDLHRRLVPVDQPYDVELLEVAWFTPTEALTWDVVLNTPCVVVLGEAGSGKTSELRGQAERLQATGRAAFFLRVEDLAKDDLTIAVEGDRSILEAWKQGSEPGWFFLDSVDEAKLHQQSLERAIAKLRGALSGQLARCHVVVSSRHSDWGKADENCLRRLVPSLVNLSIPSPNEPQSLPKAGKVHSAPDQDDAPRTLRVVQLAPLSQKQIHLYATCAASVNDGDRFLEEIAYADLWGLARRPLDVQWLATYWKGHGRFGSLREMIEENIVEKLSEKKSPRFFRRICP
jgi:hypothetical protein